jgi:hypothetical protein
MDATTEKRIICNGRRKIVYFRRFNFSTDLNGDEVYQKLLLFHIKDLLVVL